MNPFVDTASDAQSTFSIDVDTASYALARMNLTAGRRPSADEVRPEEFVNYFDYQYANPTEGPVAIHLEGAPSPFSEGKTLFRIGIKGREVPASERKPANLVFLIDVSGSMQMPNKLTLIKKALKTLVTRLNPSDTVGIVVYAGRVGVQLEPTGVSQSDAIAKAVDGLVAGGSTNAEAGIRLAYDMAEKARKPGGINRVILCTDGDFNVGLTGEALTKVIETFRDRGITLTTLGFGYGNYKDSQLENLADKGNGNYAYVDNEKEAERIFGSRLVSTLQVLAKDVKLQIDFNRDVVKRYRLIGYENRAIADWDFTNDRVDAGEMGPGHHATAYYELEFANGSSGQVANVKVRYKEPEGMVSTERSQSIAVTELKSDFGATSASFRFGTAVAAFAELLRNSPHVPGITFRDVVAIASDSRRADDPDSAEFLTLVQKAASLPVIP